MKKLFSLSLFLLTIVGLNAVDHKQSSITMKKEEAIKTIQFACWDSKRIVESGDKKSFEKIDQALNALTPETCWKNINQEELLAVLNKRLSLFYPEYKVTH